MEYAKENKQNKLMAHQFKANEVEQQAEATEELINALTEKHTIQMEALICSTTEAMKEMMTLVKAEKGTNNDSKLASDEKKKKREEKCQKYKDAPICTAKVEDECWELEKNAASCPANWTSSKSTRGCTWFTIETEKWQPGKVLDKIKINHTYPEATNYWTPALDTINEEDEEEINNTSQKAPEIQNQQGYKWMRRLSIQRESWKEH